ncbi:ankyrin repeat and SOCS box protein 16 [Protopterus annectens]|uniref:ankyrin repeat and SOCS box protein 16 n=1 Tax=Protopterus annectens TaxID=7888 RepID=UPI001CFAA9F7|nr:ankyrin repeat and SOCS box protein 16 [Protopterus annectens]
MSRETFVFTSSTLRSLRVQREILEWEDQKRALSRRLIGRRPMPGSMKSRSAKRRSETWHCRDAAIHNAVYTGDLRSICHIFKDEDSVNMIIETVSEELVWSPELGLWTLTPKQKQTSALRIAAARGYTDCLRHLLMHGADINAAPGGQTALHDACANKQTESTELLLSFGANPNVFSEEGVTPLHLCNTPETFQCAKSLLEYGAKVNLQSKENHSTALHTAAKHGLEEHLKLYLCYGADIFHRTREGETALNAACAGADKPRDSGRYYRIVIKLIECGADVKVAGRKKHTPLHNACGNAHARVVELLLQHGAQVNDANSAGYTPMDCILHAVEDYLEWQPERIVLSLFNYGAAAVDPEMLKLCALSPQTMEIVLNMYQHVPSATSWVEKVTPDVWKQHQTFYDSVIQMVNQPRQLQHIARCAVRKHLGSRCYSSISSLKLPNSLKEYLLLKLEGYIK